MTLEDLMRWFCLIGVAVLMHVAFAAPDALDMGLAAMGVTRATFHVNTESQLARLGAYRLPIFDRWFNAPLRIPTWERYLRTGLLDAHGHLQPLLKIASAIVGPGTNRDLIDPQPLEVYRKRAAQPGALAAAIKAVDPHARVPAVDRLPARVQQWAAMLLFVSADALRWREYALRHLTEPERTELYAMLLEPLETPVKPGETEPETRFPGPDQAQNFREMDLLGQVDFTTLFAGAEDLAAVVDAVGDGMKKQPLTETFSFTCHTRYGEIRLASGGKEDFSADRQYLLILHAGDQPTFHAGGATGGPDLPLGILINAGNGAVYQATTDKPAFGAGILGYGLLANLGEHATYTSSGFYAEGAGIAGVGMLTDGGQATFRARGGAQGMGAFGIGVLAAAGNDRFDAYDYCQGCGLPLGCGLLCDTGKGNQYTANDTDIIFPSAQSKEHNTSLAQGAGMGYRRDYVDGHSVSGGVGMLLDVGGDGKFFGGVFCQAVGYWGGIGILDSRGGSNSFRCVWYGQSATAHYGISYLDEAGGNNTFTATNCVTDAAAHDYSISLFLDEGGHNTYLLNGSGLGEGLNNGLALFVDLGGHNTYKSPYNGAYGQSVTFSTSGPRVEIPTFGLFIDLGGDSTYPAGGPMGNHKTWTQDTPYLHGAGLSLDGVPVRWE